MRVAVERPRKKSGDASRRYVSFEVCKEITEITSATPLESVANAEEEPDAKLSVVSQVQHLLLLYYVGILCGIQHL